MPSSSGIGYVDYVLWGNDGNHSRLLKRRRHPLTVEMGNVRRNSMPTVWENRFGQRPVIFLSNGFEHWVWDDAYPPRRISGFYKKMNLNYFNSGKSQSAHS